MDVSIIHIALKHFCHSYYRICITVYLYG